MSEITIDDLCAFLFTAFMLGAVVGGFIVHAFNKDKAKSTEPSHLLDSERQER